MADNLILTRRFARAVFVVIVAVCGAGATTTLLSAAEPTFEADVRPIFCAYCFDCHGAADEKEGGLDLR